MSSGQTTIRCRECREEIAVEEGRCPHCGTSVRSPTPLIVVSALGLVLMGGSLLDIGSLWFFGVIGLLLFATGAFLYYDRRQRIQQASSASPPVEETDEDSLF